MHFSSLRIQTHTNPAVTDHVKILVDQNRCRIVRSPFASFPGNLLGNLTFAAKLQSVHGGGVIRAGIENHVVQQDRSGNDRVSVIRSPPVFLSGLGIESGNMIGARTDDLNLPIDFA